jgi:hypothetical protein
LGDGDDGLRRAPEPDEGEGVAASAAPAERALVLRDVLFAGCDADGDAGAREVVVACDDAG